MDPFGFGTPRTIVAAAGVLLISGVVWGFAGWSNGDEEKSIVPKELSAAVLAEQAKTDPRKLGETMRETFRRDDLSDEQRDEVRRNMRQAWTGMLDERVDTYFAAAPEDREAILDTQIDEMQERMKGWAERRKEREAREKQNGEDGEQDKADQERRRRRGPQTREQRKTRSESRDPDKSARRTAYFSAMRKRAQARGIEIRGPGSGGGRGGGPRGRRG